MEVDQFQPRPCLRFYQVHGLQTVQDIHCEHFLLCLSLRIIQLHRNRFDSFQCLPKALKVWVRCIGVLKKLLKQHPVTTKWAMKYFSRRQSCSYRSVSAMTRQT
jgi:hypothetical protein